MDSVVHSVQKFFRPSNVLLRALVILYKIHQHLSLDQPVRLPIKQINSKNKNLLSESVVLTFQYTHSTNKTQLLLVHAEISWILGYLTALCQLQGIFNSDM